jgi:putative transposase
MAGRQRPAANARLSCDRDASAEAFRVGGVADHLHLVTTLPRPLSQADMLEGLKQKSSKWIKSLAPNCRHFYWQRGYGAFSVSPSQTRRRV